MISDKMSTDDIKGVEYGFRPWSESILIEIAYSYEQAAHHRRPPIVTPEL